MSGTPLAAGPLPTRPRPRIPAYCLPWHRHSSPAFSDILVTPLRQHAEIELTPWPPAQPADFDQPLIFCQIQPPPEILANPRAAALRVLSSRPITQLDDICHEITPPLIEFRHGKFCPRPIAL